MYEQRHWVYQPRIAELMAKLGNTSKVPEVLKLHKEGRYSEHLIRQPDDSAAAVAPQPLPAFTSGVKERNGKGLDGERACGG